MQLKLQLYGSSILKKKTKNVKKVTPEVREYLEAMTTLMKLYKGAGLAANQVGLPLSLVTVEIDNQIFKFINPKIIKTKGKVNSEEGCLSFPGINLTIKRHEEIWLDYVTENEENKQMRLTGILAIILQHETDHLNGITFVDRIPLIKRMPLLKQLKEIKRKSKGEKKNGS